jgi:hypothetical protein
MNNISNQFQLTIGNQPPITITTDGYNWYDSTGTILRNNLVLPTDSIISFQPLDFEKVTLKFLKNNAFKDILTLGAIFKVKELNGKTIIIKSPIDNSTLLSANATLAGWYNPTTSQYVDNYIIPDNSIISFSYPAGGANYSFTTTPDRNALIVNKNSGKIRVQKEPIIHDIKNNQTNTIGELHYTLNASYPCNASMRSIFTIDNGDKVVKNEILFSNNRINYNLGYIPNQFTSIFDYKANGGNGADGGYFYFFAKGTISPNREDQWLNEGCNEYECLEYDQNNNCIRYGDCIDYNILRDTFPLGKFLNSRDQDGYRINFDEYEANEQLAVSYAGYQVGIERIPENLICSVGTVLDNPLGLNFADGNWRTIKIKFNQGTFEIYINNTLRLSCVDSNYNNRDKSGTNFGLGGYVCGLNNYHYFKNFKFYDYLRD